MQTQKQENTRVNYINANADTNASANARNGKRLNFRALTFALAFAFHTFEPRQRKRKCKRKDNNNINKTGSIGSMPPRRIEVESKIASSILDEKLADSIRKYTVRYD